MPLSSKIFPNFSKGKISYIKIKKSETEVIINMPKLSQIAYDFTPKLHSTQFNYPFITSILKSPKYRT